MCDISSRGLEVFTALLLLSGEGNIISATLNKEQGFFTLNVGSKLFEWRTPLVTPSTTVTLPPQTAQQPPPGAPENPYSNLRRANLGIDDMSEAIIILIGIFIFSVFLLEDPFANTSGS